MRLDEAEASEPDARRQYAIDLRRAQIGASLELRRDSRKIKRNGNDHDLSEFEAASRIGIRRVAGQIARALCKTGEDPSKFLQVFFDRPGEVNEFLDNPDNSKKEGYDAFATARDELRKFGAQLDRQMYELLEFEEAYNNRFPNNKHLEDEKYRPEQPRARIYDTLSDDDADKVVDICSQIARIKSTLVIG